MIAYPGRKPCGVTTLIVQARSSKTPLFIGSIARNPIATLRNAVRAWQKNG